VAGSILSRLAEAVEHRGVGDGHLIRG
jgi:hypothetical protein